MHHHGPRWLATGDIYVTSGLRRIRKLSHPRNLDGISTGARSPPCGKYGTRRRSWRGDFAGRPSDGPYVGMPQRRGMTSA